MSDGLTGEGAVWYLYTFPQDQHGQITTILMSALLWTIDPEGPTVLSAPGNLVDMALLDKYIPNMDSYDMGWSFYRRSVKTIHKTKDGRYFHLHGNLNPTPVLESMGLPVQDMIFKDGESA